MDVTGMTVGKWRKRYREFGIESLHDELRSGRPRTYEDRQGNRSDQPSAADLGEAFSEGVAQRRQHPIEGPFPRR